MAAPHLLLPEISIEAKRDGARAGAGGARAAATRPGARGWRSMCCATMPPPAGAVVSGFWPLGGRNRHPPAAAGAARARASVVLPVTPPRGQPLGFRLWRPGDPMAPERFGTVRPTGPERHAGLPARAAARLRPARPSARLWRRLLRPHPGGAARARRAGLRLRRAGDGRSARRPARCPASPPSRPSAASSAATIEG